MESATRLFNMFPPAGLRNDCFRRLIAGFQSITVVVFSLILVNFTWAESPDFNCQLIPNHNGLALKLMDSEALFTVSGGVKPVSEGFWSINLSTEANGTSVIERVRSALRRLPLGAEYETGVVVFHDKERKPIQATAYVGNYKAVREVVLRRDDVFGPIADLENFKVQQVMDYAESSTGANRWRAFGLLFGYPEHAIEFFVEADHQRSSDQEVYPRDFFHIPTYASETGRFVFAVPKGHVPTHEDLQLKENCKLILDAYRRSRLKVICDPKFSESVLMAQWVRKSFPRASNRIPACFQEAYRDSVSSKIQVNSILVETE